MSRSAHSVDLLGVLECDNVVVSIVTEVCRQTCPEGKVVLIGDIYLNYYKNGTDFCPGHSHRGSRQVVISLGTTRVLKVGKKDYAIILAPNGVLIVVVAV